MMNRRLRERLTEEEILQVFVDVCEVSRPSSSDLVGRVASPRDAPKLTSLRSAHCGN
jgi:hypothetical protein